MRITRSYKLHTAAALLSLVSLINTLIMPAYALGRRAAPPEPGQVSATDIENATVRDLSPARAGDVLAPNVVPGVNGKITFTSTRDGGENDIFVMDPNGGSQTNLDNNTSSDVAPAWSPDGTKIAFNRGDDIFVMNADATNQVNLRPGNPADSSPAWSPDGTKIAFDSAIGGGTANQGILVMDADGTNVINITNNPSLDESSPTWSPDGTKIAFERGGNEIFVRNADGTNPVNLTNTATAAGIEANPAWSPDGTKIAFERHNTSGSSDREIFVMNANGSNLVNLTNNATLSDEAPAWSPDGTKIAWTRNINSSGGQSLDIFVMNADGSNPVNLTNNAARDDAPDWQAVASCLPATITGTLGQGSNDYPSTSGVQTGRLSQNGVNSSCASQKPTPSVASAQPFAYDAYEFVNGSNATACVTFTFPTSCGANQAIHPVAYLGSFDPNNLAANYLGDFGTSINANDPGSFSVNIPANATVVLVVHKSGTTDGCPNYSFSVAGLPCPPAAPSVSVSDVSVTEGNAGTTAFVFTVTLSNASANPVTVDFGTQDSSATVADGDYVANAGTLTFAPNDTTETITVLVNGDMKFESNEQFLVLLNNATGGATFTDANAFGNITNDDALPTPSPTPTTPTFQFDSSVYTVEEGCTFVTGHVLRTGPSGTSVSVDVTSDDGSARQKGDYNIVLAHLVFGAGETDKTFQVLINDDSYTEGLEVATLLLQRPTGGVLGIPSTAGLQITDNSPETSSNPIDGSQDFVCQHYHDFLYRQADQAGQDFWTNVIESCGTDTTCRQAKRVEVSTAFFLSIEFQQTGYFVIRAHKAAFGNLDSNPRYTVFQRDQRQIGEGVIVGEPGFQQQLDTNRQNYLADFVSRPEFVVQFPLGSAAATYVDRLFLNAGATPTTTGRSAAISAYGPGDSSGRVAALESVIESGSVFNAQYNPGFVLMQYYGYLRRNPDDAPDNNFSGYDFWLAKMNSFTLPGEDARIESVALARVRRAEMVKAFITSAEHRERFFGAAGGNQQVTVEMSDLGGGK